MRPSSSPQNFRTAFVSLKDVLLSSSNELRLDQNFALMPSFPSFTRLNPDPAISHSHNRHNLRATSLSELDAHFTYDQTSFEYSPEDEDDNESMIEDQEEEGFPSFCDLSPSSSATSTGFVTRSPSPGLVDFVGTVDHGATQDHGGLDGQRIFLAVSSFIFSAQLSLYQC